jgi:hypothetical protein
VFYDWLTYFWQQMQAPWVVIDGMYNMPWLWVILQPLRGLGRYGLLAVVLLGLIVSITLPILFAATPPAPLFVGIWVFLWWWMLWMFGVI